ncbi:hypothetical protein RUM44_005977 [Polyplax serrata]|uniref:Uncharacterized protein n=1 Tax=Polyplax serrata TaxID=468196 RepID=A0ABR1AYL4_POLSC
MEKRDRQAEGLGKRNRPREKERKRETRRYLVWGAQQGLGLADKYNFSKKDGGQETSEKAKGVEYSPNNMKQTYP